MRALVLALLALMPLSCLAIGLPSDSPFQFKTNYFRIDPSGNCSQQPKVYLHQNGGDELGIFNCDGKSPEQKICYCVAGNINDRTVTFRKMCGTCGLSLIPDPGYEKDFQFYGFIEIYINLVGKLMRSIDPTDDDFYLHGTNNDVKIPTTSPNKIRDYALYLQVYAKGAPKMTALQKEQVVKTMKRAYRLYSGEEKIPSVPDNGDRAKEKLVEGLQKYVPQLWNLMDCAQEDGEPGTFNKKLETALASLNLR